MSNWLGRWLLLTCFCLFLFCPTHLKYVLVEIVREEENVGGRVYPQGWQEVSPSPSFLTSVFHHVSKTEMRQEASRREELVCSKPETWIQPETYIHVITFHLILSRLLQSLCTHFSDDMVSSWSSSSMFQIVFEVYFTFDTLDFLDKQVRWDRYKVWSASYHHRSLGLKTKPNK